MIRGTVLALNVGSSSLKFGLYTVQSDAVVALATGQADTAHDGAIEAKAADGKALAGGTGGDAVTRIASLLERHGLPAPDAIGHRIVHGGPAVRHHCVLDAGVLAKLHDASAFAPLHVPPALAMVGQAGQHYARVPQVACIDTAFHAHMPRVEGTLPLPAAIRDKGIERYGFHGLSCESIVRELGPDLPTRTVIAHLGNGASVTAVLSGHSVDTSMGLTPAGGIVMGTRPGDLDPGIVAWLLREKAFDADALDQLVNRKSGLLGLSGLSADMRELHEAATTKPAAALAIDVFVHAARKQIAAMATSLGGIDLLVFSGGIGEHDAVVRRAIHDGLRWLGLTDLHVAVVPSREDEEIAIRTWQLAAPGVGDR
jgi:acetate kinase